MITICICQEIQLYFGVVKLGAEEEQIIPAFMKDDDEVEDDNGETGGAKYNQEGIDKIESIIKLIKQGKDS